MREQDTQLVDRLYAVALEPERLPELLGLLADRADLLAAGGDLLERHLLRAAQMMQALRQPSAHEQTQIADDAQPVFSVDRTGVVRDFNPAAGRAYGLSLGCSVDVLPLDATGHRRLRAHLDGRQASAGQSLFLLQVMRSDVARPLLISIEPHASQTSVFQLRTTDIVWHARLEPLLAASFDLTGSEVDIARRVFLGESITEIASSRDTSVATVRTQVRAVYQKTGATGQTEVIRLMSALAALYPMMPEDPLSGWHASAAADDVGLYSMGVESAPCCLMLGDEFHLAAVPLALQQAARDGRLRLLYGRRSTSPQDSAEQMAALLRSLGIARCTVLALGRGALTAQMLAAVDPVRISRVVLAAPVLPGADAEAGTCTLPPFERLLRVAARGPRGLLDFLAAAALLTESRLGVAAMLGLISTTGRGGHAVAQMFRLPGSPTVDRAACLAADVRATETADWQAFHGCGVPLRVLLGGADPVGASLARRWLDGLGDDSVETLAGADALLGYTHGAAVLAALLEG